MSNILKYLVLFSLTMMALANQNSCQDGQLWLNSTCMAVNYIEGCFQYDGMNTCQSCEFNYQLTNDKKCLKGNSTSYNANNCCVGFNSDGTCKTCNAGLFADASYCYSYAIQNCIKKGASGCQMCMKNTFLLNGLCYPQVSNCKAYSNAGTCQICQDGYTLNTNYNYCQLQSKPVQNCNVTSKGICSVCSIGYYLTQNGTCNIYEFGCLQYWQGKCLICASNFLLTNISTCIIENCIAYSSDGCIKCQSPLIVESDGVCSLNNCLKFSNNKEDNYCKENNKENNCKDNSKNSINNNNNKCLRCKQNYRLGSNYSCIAAVSFKCNSCQSGYVFINNACVIPLTGCATYSNNNSISCVKCLDNFILAVNGQCLMYGCAQYNNNGCASCLTPFVLSPSNNVCYISNCLQYNSNGCSLCSSSYTLSTSKTCYLPDSNCVKYSSTMQSCLQCITTYYLNSNYTCSQKVRGCSYANNDLNCNKCISNYVKTSNGTCIIVGCDQYDNNDGCKVCLSPFVFKNAACTLPNCMSYSNTLPSFCLRCQNGFILAANGTCLQKDIYCQAYSNAICSKCMQGYYLQANTLLCYANIVNCQQNNADRITCQYCQPGYLLTNNNTACRIVIQNCQEYIMNSSCRKCNPGYHLNQRICVINQQTCSSYQKTNSNDDSNEICTSCSNGYQLTNDGQCLVFNKTYGCVYNKQLICISCKEPFQYSPSTNTCFISGCNSYNDNGCLSCVTPFTFQPNLYNCIISNCLKYTSNGCSQCVNGYALQNSNGLCVSVDLNCLTFATNNSCLQCISNYGAVNGVCVSVDLNCLSYSTDGTCFKCKDSCYFNPQKQCSVKENGCIYQYGVCSLCALPFTMNTATNKCQITNCLETNSQGCVTCRSFFNLNPKTYTCSINFCQRIVNNTCVLCNSGYHLSQGIRCILNDVNCLFYDSDGNCNSCSKGYLLMSSGECQNAQRSCLSTCQSDVSKCLSCQRGYFLNRYFQCQKEDGFCLEYRNGVCSRCKDAYFLFEGICFPYSKGCVKYSGKDCLQCKNNYILTSNQCLLWIKPGMKLEGTDDTYNFDITPIDVRQSKYYIDNLSPLSNIAKLFYTSSFDTTYQDATLTTQNTATGKGWKAKLNDTNQNIGYQLQNGNATTFFAVQLESVEDNYITSFYLEYSVNGNDYIRVQTPFFINSSSITNNQIATIYFTGIYAKSIRIAIASAVGWPACRIQFFFYDYLNHQKIANLKSLKFLENTINQTFVDRVDNQLYINQAYFFNPQASCTQKQLCFTGLQLCQVRNISSFTLYFDKYPNTVTEFYLTYSIDGRNYNCYRSCVKYQVKNITNNQFSMEFIDLQAQSLRIYPTAYVGDAPTFNTAFYYS